MQAPPDMAARRWDSLDSLRGVAALLVVTFHCAQVAAGFAVRTNPLSLAAWSEPWTWLKYTPLRVLVSSGPSAVVLFFVLSGFVLSLPFLRAGPRPSYAGFALKRLCRIYPAFAVTILISAALYAFVQPAPIPALSEWFNEVLWDQPLTPGYVARNLAMTGIQADMTLDLVMWSLVHELRISLVFPALFLATRRWPVASLIASVAIGVACTAMVSGEYPRSIPMSFVDSGRFVFLFTIGIVLAGNVAAIRRRMDGLSGLVVLALWLLAAALILSPGPTLYRYFNFTWGVGAALMVALTVGSLRVDRALSAAALGWLGRVSYSLYLVHLPLLIAAVHLADGHLPLTVTIPAAVLASLIAAEAMYRAVEVPGIRLGRHLARRADAMLSKPAGAPVAPVPAWSDLRGSER